jgi:hypothetical protein
MLTTRPIQGVLLEYDLPDATGIAVRAEVSSLKPEVPVLLFAGIGTRRRSHFGFSIPISATGIDQNGRSRTWIRRGNNHEPEVKTNENYPQAQYLHRNFCRRIT